MYEWHCLTDRSLNELNAGLEVQTKVNKVPLDAFLLVLLLLQDEHSVIEELLQFLIGVVDAQLLKWVILWERQKRKALSLKVHIWILESVNEDFRTHLKNLKPSNV